MTLEVLVAAVNQCNYKLLDTMNIQSDVIVANQCDVNSIEQFEFKGHQATFLNFAERGVGLNRNNALMRAKADLCLLADDDMTYVDGYYELVEEAFTELPDADVIIFNLVGRDTGRDKTTKTKRIHYYNFLKYGTARIGIRLESIRKNGIFFNLCFGGGTEHSHGEDNLFLHDCLQKHLRIYAVPTFIGKLNEERNSTWNNGYGLKYIKDQGFLYHTMSHRWWKLLCLQDALRHYKRTGMKLNEVYYEMTHL